MTPEQRILQVLAIDDRELYGLDLVTAGVAKRRWVYIVMSRMEERGLIEGREGAGEPPRRLYRITDADRVLLLPTAKVR